jgi:proteasome lid subunit RPN8/RPN11
MSNTRRAWFAAWLSAFSAVAVSNDALPGCMSSAVDAHVRQQFDIYGPLSIEREYFGLIYRSASGIDSAVTRSAKCRGENCLVNVAAAARAMPKGVSVVGEWHTHPRSGSRRLSEYDVRGAYLNRHLACYAAYYSQPDGEIVAWNPRENSVLGAMASRVRLGNYQRDRFVIDDTAVYVAHRMSGVRGSRGAPLATGQETGKGRG